MTEWQSIIASGAIQHSYGSCIRSGRKPAEPTSRHYVEPNDTLQGIALKYETTTEELRRINKLYLSDSLLLRKFLIVPVSKNRSPERAHSPQINSEDVREQVTPASKNTLTNGLSDISKDTDVHSFLQKLDMQISAGKKAVCTIISEPNYEIPSVPSATSSRLLRRRSSFEHSTATTFSNKLTSNDDEELFRL